jgi:hypothetical protein
MLNTNAARSILYQHCCCCCVIAPTAGGPAARVQVHCCGALTSVHIVQSTTEVLKQLRKTYRRCRRRVLLRTGGLAACTEAGRGGAGGHRGAPLLAEARVAAGAAALPAAASWRWHGGETRSF